MAFYVGQKVVCVDADPGSYDSKGVTASSDMDGLAHGRVYTIRAAGVDPFWREPALWLDEVVRPIRVVSHEVGFGAFRFRPVVERETDISIFRAMLNPAKKAAETVGFLAAGWAIMVAVQFAQFLGGQ